MSSNTAKMKLKRCFQNSQRINCVHRRIYFYWCWLLFVLSIDSVELSWTKPIHIVILWYCDIWFHFSMNDCWKKMNKGESMCDLGVSHTIHNSSCSMFTHSYISIHTEYRIISTKHVLVYIIHTTYVCIRFAV